MSHAKPWIRKVTSVPGAFEFTSPSWVLYDGWAWHACWTYEDARRKFVRHLRLHS